jgi:hypothetical protein
MDRIYEAYTDGSAPAAPAAPATGYPRSGTPGTPATVPGAYWYHMMTESVRNVLAGLGVTPDHLDHTLLLEAVRRAGGAHVTTLTASATLTLAQAGLVEVDASAGNVVVTLPAAADLAALGYMLVRIDGSANTVTITAAGGEAVGGAATLPLQVGGIKLIKSNGVNEYHLLSGDVLPYAMVSNASSQSIPNTADTLKTFDTIDSDLASLWDAANNQFVIPHNALIRVTACNTWGSNTVGARSIRVIRGAVATVGCPSLKIESPSVATTLTMTISSTIMEAVAGDTVRVILYQNSGGALNTTANAPQNWFSVEVVKWL